MLRSFPTRLPLLVLVACCVALVAPAGASAAPGPLLKVGSFGSGSGQFNNPEGLAIDADGNVYVADNSNSRVAVFGPGGRFLRAFGKNVGGSGVDVCTTACGSGAFEWPVSATAGAVYTPDDVAFDASERLFVSGGNGRIDVFTKAGAFLYAFGKEVAPGGAGVCTAATGCQEGDYSDEAGTVSEVPGLAVMGNSVYAADSSYNRVSVFALDGTFQFAFGEEVSPGGADICTLLTGCVDGNYEGEAALDAPVDVAAGPAGNLYIAYGGSPTGVAVFTPQGAFLRRFGNAGPSALQYPSALSVDSAGAVHVADQTADEVKTFTAAGAFSSSFPAAEPTGLAQDCRGAFWVSYADESEVIRYGEPGTAPAPCPPPVVPIATVVPSNKFKFGKLVLDKKKGTATLTVNVPAAGKLVLKGNGLKKATKTAKKAGNVKLAVKAKGKSLKKLKEEGKATLKAKLTFTPTGGTALTKPRSLVLKQTLG